MKPGATPTTFPQDISNGTPTGGASEQPLTEAQIRTCQNNFDDALRAAHNVEVGDFAMEQKNYRAARDRYSDALTEKPGDAAIYVRLGRAEEQISDFPNAKAHYAEAVKLGAPKKWADEANAAVERIDKQHAKDLRESPH
jgi:predicted Zn-dependent protease